MTFSDKCWSYLLETSFRTLISVIYLIIWTIHLIFTFLHPRHLVYLESIILRWKCFTCLLHQMLPFQLQSRYSFSQQIIFEKHVNSHEAEGWVRYVPWLTRHYQDTCDALFSHVIKIRCAKGTLLKLIWIFLVMLRCFGFRLLVIHILNPFSLSESWEISRKKEVRMSNLFWTVIALSLS